MAEQIPSIGRIVHYRLSASDAQAISKRRHDALTSDISAQNSGAQVHVGNHVEEGHVYPAMIVRVWGHTPQSVVNLQVFLDGNDTFWATSRQWDDTGEHRPGTWVWPPRVGA